MSLEQIGQKLKCARESQGLSIRQIYERTKIPVGHLQSIESGQADELPEPVYVAGFIKRYAECVGLNGQALCEEYRSWADDKSDNGHYGRAVKVVSQPVYINPDHLGRVKIDREPPTFKTIYFNAFWIVVVVGLVYYLVTVQLNNQVNQQDPSLIALREASQRYQSSATNPTSSTASGSQIASEDARISLSASQHVWVEVKSVATGESLFTGYLEPGDRRDFQDQQGLRVRAGNGGSLTVDFQGKIGAFGEAGKVAERTFLSRSQALAGSGSGEKEVKPAATAPRPASAPRRVVVRKSDDSESGGGSRYRSVEDVSTRRYIPGESLGGRRSIDVPYRYSEGRLDLE